MRQRHLCHSLKILLHRWPQVTELPRETFCRPCHITVLHIHASISLYHPSSFFSPPRVCLCCACFMFTVSRLFCPVLEHLDSNHPQTRHPPAFRYFRKSRSLRDIQQIGASSTRPPFLHALPTKLGTTLQTSVPLCTPAIA